MSKFLLSFLLLLLAGCGSGLCPLGTPRSQTCYVSGAGGGSVVGSMGVLDTSFNGTGVFTTTISFIDAPHAMALQSDGKIVVVAESFVANLDYGIVRVHSNGSLDTTFNGTGKRTLNIGVSNVASGFYNSSNIGIARYQ